MNSENSKNNKSIDQNSLHSSFKENIQSEKKTLSSKTKLVENNNIEKDNSNLNSKKKTIQYYQIIIVIQIII